ncbi:hypothetical protein, partial [Streptomyces chattanoogensis]|uniref:hypothetical protein n=1 Tax=Streptomyces chattanoogensis TaxID=66876 RepID=UPI001B80832B
MAPYGRTRPYGPVRVVAAIRTHVAAIRPHIAVAAVRPRTTPYDLVRDPVRTFTAPRRRAPAYT